MKKVFLTIIILSIAVASVFGLVACDPNDLPNSNTQITDPNEFIKQFKETTEFTFYGYDDKCNMIGKISRNCNGEMMVIEGDDEAYVIKENDIYTLYTKTAVEWIKETDESNIEEMLNSFTQAELVAQLNEVGVLAKNDDGYWYGTTDNEKKACFKMEDGMFVGYIKINEKWVKSSAIELKADIKLPEEAKNAVDITHITDPNEFVKLLKKNKEITTYSYDWKGNCVTKISINSNGEIACIDSEREMYLIKENNIYTLYTTTAGEWTKETDELKIEEFKNLYNINIEEFAKQLGRLIKYDNGYWYLLEDYDKIMPLKMEKGMLVTYTSRDGAMVKNGAIELKADIKLPPDAKN